MSARKAHNTGRNHIVNVRDYFLNLGTNQTQSMIDNIANSHEGAMYAAPSMRLGQGFMNPAATAPGGGECADAQARIGDVLPAMSDG
jgi:U1 small nuclear ribonucleoprotein C